MELMHAVFAGMGMLILAYLAFKNPNGVTAMFTGVKSLTVGDIQALQGR